MKKIILLSILLLLAVTPAQAQTAQKPSLYAMTETAPALVLPYKSLVFFDEANFNTVSKGAFILQSETFIAQGYSGLIRVTGNCYQYIPGNYVSMYINTNAGMFLVAGSTDKFMRFEFVTASNWLQIGARMNIQTYNTLSCSIVLEAVE